MVRDLWRAKENKAIWQGTWWWWWFVADDLWKPPDFSWETTTAVTVIVPLWPHSGIENVYTLSGICSSPSLVVLPRVPAAVYCPLLRFLAFCTVVPVGNSNNRTLVFVLLGFLFWFICLFRFSMINSKFNFNLAGLSRQWEPDSGVIRAFVARGRLWACCSSPSQNERCFPPSKS